MATNKIKLVVKPTRSIPMVVKPVPKIGLMSMAPTKGDPGVGIESLEQTTKSTESGGTNVWTATLTDGTVHDFEVMNGDPGDGIATGGTPGQVLVKASNADYATRWMDILPEDTASGAVASFPDGADDLPMGVVVDIDPVQDLNGYDNPWPGGGGKNLLNPNAKTTNPSNVYFYIDSGFLVKEGVTYTVTYYGQENVAGIYINKYGISTTESIAVAYNKKTITFTPSEDTMVYLNLYWVTGTSHETADEYFQLEIGSTSTSYAPYSNICPISGWTGAKVYHSGADTSNPTEYEIPFSTEVYGGKLNVETGELVVDKKSVYLNNPNLWESRSGGTTTLVYNSSMFSDRKKYSTSYDGFICSYYGINRTGTETARWTGAISNFFGINSTVITLEQIKADAIDNKVQVVYELATPITLTLDPVEIRSLFGDNNVFADTGNTTVTYKADVQKYIDKKISAAVAAMS